MQQRLSSNVGRNSDLWCRIVWCFLPSPSRPASSCLLLFTSTRDLLPTCRAKAVSFPVHSSSPSIPSSSLLSVIVRFFLIHHRHLCFSPQSTIAAQPLISPFDSIILAVTPKNCQSEFLCPVYLLGRSRRDGLDTAALGWAEYYAGSCKYSVSSPSRLLIAVQPAFLRASHSPWRFIPQNILVILRGTVLAYLLASAIMGADYKLSLNSDYTNWRVFFDFAIVSFVLTFIYHVITFVSFLSTRLLVCNADLSFRRGPLPTSTTLTRKTPRAVSRA